MKSVTSHRRYQVSTGLAILLLILAFLLGVCSVAPSASAGNIFDDDWPSSKQADAQAADNPVDQYALLVAAFNVAKEGASLVPCFEAVDVMARTYGVDAVRTKSDVAFGIDLKSDSPAIADLNVKAALSLVEDIVDAEDFGSAMKLCEWVKPLVASK
jgi:hypothetical protein